MRRRQKIKKYTILSLLLVTFILSIDFADAKNGKWKPGNENDRRFPTARALQNDRRIPTGKTIENNRTMQIEEKIQNDRRISNGRILQNGRRIPTGKTIQNDRRLQIDGNMKSDKIIFNDRILQNDKRIPIGKVIQNDRRIPIGKVIQNDRRIPIDRTLQNDRRILTGQNDTMHTDRKIKNDRIMQYNRRVHNNSLSDRIMQEDGRKRINRILKNYRLTKNELQKKIDSLSQNINIQKDNIVRDGRRMLNVSMMNDRKTQNDLKVARKNFDERNQEMINTRRMGYEETIWAATPQRIARQRGWVASPKPIARYFKSVKTSKFNSSEFIKPNYTMPPSEKVKGQGWWGKVWANLEKSMGSVHRELPYKHHYLLTRACHIIATTQISSQLDLRKYFTLRYFYENNLEYEVGYLVNEIVSKYQRMLELYDLATQYYFKNQGKFYAPSTYVLYLYTNVLEMGTVISHLCNMLNELENKYKFIPVNQTGFSDYHLVKRAKGSGVDQKMAAQIAAYEKALAKKKRQLLKQNRKNRAKELNFDMVVTTPDRRPKNSNFPLDYGWSIEGDW